MAVTNSYGVRVHGPRTYRTLTKDLRVTGLGGPSIVPKGTRLQVVPGFPVKDKTDDSTYCFYPGTKRSTMWVENSMLK